MFKTETLDQLKVTYGQISSPGTRYKDRKIVKLSTIYISPAVDNPVRSKGLDYTNVQKLTKTLSMGINYSKMPPVVRWNPRIIDGVHYDYELITGNHRITAMKSLGYTEWIFDIYEFATDDISYEDSVRTFQLQENDHEPALASSTADVVNMISRLIQQNSSLVTNDEKSIGAYISKFCPNLNWQTQGAIVRRAVQANGAYQDIVTYNAENLKKWLKLNTNLVNEGEYDKQKDMYGWSCLSRYEHEVIFNCIKKYSQTRKESYITCHTSAPTEKYSLQQKRENIIENFEVLEDALIDIMDFYNKNKRFPWQVLGFYPQDRKNGESKMISKSSVQPLRLTALVA
jgi:hypothetical protein